MFKSRTIAVVFISLVLGSSSGAIAQTAPSENPTTLNRIKQGIQQGRQAKQDVDSVLQAVKNFPSAIANLPSMLLGQISQIQIPSIEEIISAIEDGSTGEIEGGALSERIENNLPGKGSPAILRDATNDALVQVAIENASSLSSPKSQRSIQQIQGILAAINQQSSILSQAGKLFPPAAPSAITANTESTAFNTNQLTQQNKQIIESGAINNALTARLLEETSASNIVQRRDAVTAANNAVGQAGLFSLFGMSLGGRSGT